MLSNGGNGGNRGNGGMRRRGDRFSIGRRQRGSSVDGPPPTAAMEGERAAWMHFLTKEGQEKAAKTAKVETKETAVEAQSGSNRGGAPAAATFSSEGAGSEYTSWASSESRRAAAEMNQHQQRYVTQSKS